MKHGLPLRALFALVLTLGTDACGRRGDPMPPELRRPGPPANVRISGEAGNLVLSWDAPAEDLAGRRIESPAGYTVLRAAWPPGEEPCESCPQDLKPVATLDSVERRGRRLPETAWSDLEAQPGWLYRYRIRALDREDRPGPLSSFAQIRWVALTPPRVEAAPGDGQALISVLGVGWPAEVKPVGLRVYGPQDALLAEGASSAQVVFVAGLQNGIEHTLRVRLAAQTSDGWFVESPETRVRVTPADTTPPLPPSDLVALRTAEGVRLRWLPSGREPYAEVLVLRGEETEGLVETARVPGSSTEYLDAGAVSGRAYTYAVIATDQAGNKSLPTRAVRVRPQ